MSALQLSIVVLIQNVPTMILALVGIRMSNRRFDEIEAHFDEMTKRLEER